MTVSRNADTRWWLHERMFAVEQAIRCRPRVLHGRTSKMLAHGTREDNYSVAIAASRETWPKYLCYPPDNCTEQIHFYLASIEHKANGISQRTFTLATLMNWVLLFEESQQPTEIVWLLDANHRCITIDHEVGGLKFKCSPPQEEIMSQWNEALSRNSIMQFILHNSSGFQCFILTCFSWPVVINSHRMNVVGWAGHVTRDCEYFVCFPGWMVSPGSGSTNGCNCRMIKCREQCMTCNRCCPLVYRASSEWLTLHK